MENEIIKLQDGRKVAIDRSVGVTMFCFTCKDGDIYFLAVQRSEHTSDSKLLWNLPSGYLNWDETGEQAALRETLEETGIYINPDIVSEVEHSTSPLEHKQHVIFRYAAFVPVEYLFKEFSPQTKSEIKEVLWIHENDINKYEWAFNQDKFIKRTIEKFRHPFSM